jgi:hypothetical protein
VAEPRNVLERYVDVRCPNCDEVRRITDRQYRRAKDGGSIFLCRRCRSRQVIVVTEEDRAYWLERYPIEWIVETATMIWGSPRRPE